MGESSFKEGVTALIALAITTVTLILIWHTYFDAAAAEPIHGHEVDIVEVCIGLLGTVTGYYLGRVPAEARADAAEQSAKTSQANLTAATATAQAASAQTDAIRNQVRNLAQQLSGPPMGGAALGAPGAADIVSRLEQILQS